MKGGGGARLPVHVVVAEDQMASTRRNRKGCFSACNLMNHEARSTPNNGVERDEMKMERAIAVIELSSDEAATRPGLDEAL